MNEGLRNIAVLVWALCAVNSNSYAQEGKMIIAEETAAETPTVVYGAAKKADGGWDEVVVEQPEGAPNPLGDPIVAPVSNNEQTAPVQLPQQNDTPVLNNTSATGDAPAVSSAPDNNTLAGPQVIGQPVVQTDNQLGAQFQNTVLEANGRVYDVQSYPEQDLKVMDNPSQPGTIYSPNVNP